MLRQSDLEMHPSMLDSALPPGVHVCPWGTGDDRAEMTLVGHSRRKLATLFPLSDPDSMDAAREKLLERWPMLEPRAARPDLKLLA